MDQNTVVDGAKFPPQRRLPDFCVKLTDRGINYKSRVSNNRDMSIKGWTKMDEGSWRHDASKYNQNKLNIYGETDEGEIHVADMRKGEVADFYTVQYTYNDDSGRGTEVIVETETKEAAREEAAEFMRDHKTSAPEY